MPITLLTGTSIRSGSIPVTALGGGVVSSSNQVTSALPTGTVSSSAQVKPLLPADTVTSSAQVKTFLPVGTVTSSAQYPGWVTASSQIDYNSITNKLSGVVSASAQVAPLLPAGTVSSSGQVDYNAITNKLSGVVSSSTQVAPLLPNGTVSSSAQVVAGVASQTIAPTTVNATNITASALTANQAVFTNASDGFVSNAITGTGNVVMSASPTLTGTLTAANITANGTLLLQNIVSQSSAPTFTGLTSTGTVLLAGIYSSSGQTDITATTGYSTFSSSLATVDAGQTTRIDNLASLTSSYAINSTIQSQLAGVVSSSAQVKPLLPGGTVSSSVQYPGWVTASSQIQLNSITGTTFGTADFTFPQNLTVAGNLTAQQFYTEFVSASVIYESGSTKFGDSNDDVMSVTGSIRVLGGNISGSFIGLVSQSSQIDYNSIQNKLSGVVSSSAQVKPLLPDGTVTSSAQYPGWVTASSQIDYNSIQNKLSGVVSSSAQVKPLLPDGTVSSSAQVVAGVAAQTIAPTTVNATNITASALTANQAVFTNASDGFVSNAITGTGNVVMSASPTLTGTLTAANITANGTLLLQNIVSQSSAPTFTGLTSTGTVLLQGIVSQSSQIDYNSITNKLSGVYSSSAFATVNQGTLRLTFNGVALSDVDTGLQSNDRPLFSGSQFSGIVSGSGIEYRLVVPVGTNFYAT